MFLAGGEGRSSMGKQMAKIVQAANPNLELLPILSRFADGGGDRLRSLRFLRC
jgi:hypothetical protein